MNHIFKGCHKITLSLGKYGAQLTAKSCCIISIFELLHWICIYDTKLIEDTTINLQKHEGIKTKITNR